MLIRYEASYQPIMRRIRETSRLLTAPTVHAEVQLRNAAERTIPVDG
jgi:hypothetical protein